MINANLKQECEPFLLRRDRVGAYNVCERFRLPWEDRIKYVDALIDLMYVEDVITSKEWNDLRG
jgi:hypothetical protein